MKKTLENNIFLKKIGKVAKPEGYPLFNLNYNKIKSYLETIKIEYEKDNYKYYVRSIYTKLIFDKTDKAVALFLKKNNLEEVFRSENEKKSTTYKKIRIELGKIHKLCKFESKNIDIKPFDKSKYLSTDNYVRYAGELKYGYIPDIFYKDLNEIEEAEDKIQFIKVINKCIDEEIENVGFIISSIKHRIKKDDNKDPVTTYNLERSEKEYSGAMNYLKNVQQYVYEELYFWEKEISDRNINGKVSTLKATRTKLHPDDLLQLINEDRIKDSNGKLENLFSTNAIYKILLNTGHLPAEIDKQGEVLPNMLTRSLLEIVNNIDSVKIKNFIEENYKSNVERFRLYKLVIKEVDVHIMNKELSHLRGKMNEEVNYLESILSLGANDKDIDLTGHNSGVKDASKIQWCTETSDLAYFIKNYDDDQILLKRFIKVIKNNFRDQNGKDYDEFAPNYIRQQVNNLLKNRVRNKYKSKNGDMIDSILESNKFNFTHIAKGLIERGFILKEHEQLFIKAFQEYQKK